MRGLRRHVGLSCLFALGLVLWMGALRADTAALVELREAIVVEVQPFDEAGHAVQQVVSLPDDWAQTRPGFAGTVTYRATFDAPPASDDPPSLYVERACANLEVRLNGTLLMRDPAAEPQTANCYRPQLIVLPAALLHPTANELDIKVTGLALEQVSARQRAGGLSELLVGPQSQLLPRYENQQFWNVTMAQVLSLTLVVVGLFMLGLAWARRSEPAYLYFGLLLVGWTAIASHLWSPHIPLDPRLTEVLIACLYAPVVACAVLFLQRYGGHRHRWVDVLLGLQCLLVPVSIAVVPASAFFLVTAAWATLYLLEVTWASGYYLARLRRERRPGVWIMGAALLVMVLLAALETAVQHGWVELPRVHLIHFAMPLLFFAVGLRLVQQFVHALQSAETARADLEQRILEKTAEIERSYAELAEARIEQVAEAERKRIAGDLHDDLGAKLLTIVHTSGDERISTLAREALEEMRLSVRGLTGKPVKIADALADWRAEVVSRLGQAAVQVEWQTAHENDERHLSARAYVQTTRILREAISNIIKHSGASACTIRCVIDEVDFNLVIQDNGRGIPLELDGKLDRGHGMASMKRRAKQLAGQCLVESGPGFGTVIRLTLPL
ncbi:histidine kinase [Caldimonas thermodepolymerans]|uniref:histidine kinase n=2 Tax=Caldimonas thermodepolymerans TaxID=215580 RepID=A0A2S5T606_9BURK|nr:histidine kinase [Caldimonas thermodepolymerans]QPC33480.1 histidine kinase [Caldimonas thermodepolymerans]RDH96550.1 signal transduction histidine kinase [Caldimonas thermodepolymerans]